MDVFGITGGDTIAMLKSYIGGVAQVAWLQQEVALAQSYIWRPKVAIISSIITLGCSTMT